VALGGRTLGSIPGWISFGQSRLVPIALAERIHLSSVAPGPAQWMGAVEDGWMAARRSLGVGVVAVHRKASLMPTNCAGYGVSVQGSLAPAPERHILPDMKRLFRKWRLVRLLSREILVASDNVIPAKQKLGFTVIQKQVVIVRGLFASMAADHFSWKISEVNSLLDSCISDEYMCRVTREDNPTFFIKTTSKGEDFREFTDLMQAQLSRYDKVLLVTVSILGTILGTVATFLAAKYGWKAAEFASKLLTGH
jgi:hypothetical protein